ncbi:coil containing protein [Vibrio phage 1.170.O._10N.261.52.C3]|nr:coil containing protein [Vibrio phage 1.170.O._10N.261.52.C3]
MARNANKAKKPTPPRDSSTTRDGRQGKNQKGTVAIETVRKIVDCIKPYELSESQRLHTYQNMLLDDAVATPFYFSCTLVEKSFSNYDIEYDKNDPKSIVAAEFLKHNLENMQSSLRTLARNAAESQRDGLSPVEKTFKKEKDGEWKNFWTIDKLPYIHPLTLDSSEPFIITDNGRKVTAMQQNRNAFQNSAGTITNYTLDGSLPSKIKIPRKKLLFFNYSTTDAQPFGVSAFDAAYTAWREKVLLQDYTLVGVTKDFAGTPILYIPGEILAEADADPSSQAGIMVEQLRSNAANMHTGDQNFIIMPSDTINEAGSGAKAFEIKFQG